MSPPDELARRLDGVVERAQAEQRLPSIVACAFRDGVPVWQRALGLADVERGEPATLDHVYRVGSITKTFTAVAIMRLRDEGLLDLDAPVRSKLPEFPPGPTFRQALSHSTGLQREPPGEIWESLRPPDREQLVAGLEDAERVLRPGLAFHYSNLVFALLGEVVARTGVSYETTLRERILEPLDLERTALHPAAPVATPYFLHPWHDRPRPEPDLEVTESTGAAGWLWSTVGDLARWGDFLCVGHEAVLARSTLDEMARVQTMVDEERWSVGWGLGLELVRRGDRVLVGHGGAMPGFLAALMVHRATRTGAAVLLNAGNLASPETIALDLAEAAIDLLETPVEPWVPDVGPPADVEPLLGQWWIEGDELIVRWRDGRLEAELTAGPPGRRVSVCEREHDDVWRVVSGRERGELLRVVRDAEGRAVKLYLATYPVTRLPAAFGGSAS